MKDATDIDVDDTVPVLHRGIPQIPELFDTGVVHQKTHGSDITISPLGQLSHRFGVAHVAHGDDGGDTLHAQFITQRRGGCGVDVGEYHFHAETAGVAGETCADTCAGTRDDGNAARKYLSGAHRLGTDSAVGGELGQWDRVGRVEDDVHLGELQPVGTAPHADFGHAA